MSGLKRRRTVHDEKPTKAKTNQNREPKKMKVLEYSKEFENFLEWSEKHHSTLYKNLEDIIDNFMNDNIDYYKAKKIEHEKSLKRPVTYSTDHTLWRYEVTYDYRLIFSKNGTIKLHRVGKHTEIYKNY